jgi:hypothetical protein
LGDDWTLHAAVDGVVKFSKKRITNFNGRTYLTTFAHVVPNTPKAEIIAPAKVLKTKSVKATTETKAKKAVSKKA